MNIEKTQGTSYSPLDTLLWRLSNGPVLTLSSLAEELAVSQELVEQMLAQLERAGYLSVAGACCAGACAGCGAGAGCAIMHGGRIWSLTDKGARALEAHHRDAENV